MIRLALGTIRSRKGAFAGAFVAILLSSTLASACGTLMESALRAGAPTERYSGVPVVVGGKQSVSWTTGHGEDRETESDSLPEKVRLDPGMATTLRGLSGVDRVVTEVSVPGQLFAADRPVPANKALWAHGWDSAGLTPFRLTAGRAPRGGGEIVVDAGTAARGALRPGARVTLAAASETRMDGAPVARQYTVVGVVAPPRGTQLDRQSAVFLDPAEALRLAGGRVDAFGVYPAAGTSARAVATAAKHALGADRVSARTGHGRGLVEFLDIAKSNEDMVSIAGAFGGIALAVAVFVVMGTFAFSVQQRHRELGLLRAVGATPWQVRRMISGEALVLATVAGLCGVAPGIGLAHVLRDQFVSHGIIPDTFRIAVGWIPMLVAVGSGIVVSQLAVFFAGWRAGRIRPTQALTEAGAPRRRLGVIRILLGVIALAGAIVVAGVSMSLHGDNAAASSIGVVMSFMVAVGFLGPLLARIAIALAGPLMGGFSRASGYLAAAHSRSDARRLASVFTPMTLCVAISCTVLFTQTTIKHGTLTQGRERVVADRVIQPTGPGVPAGAVARVATLPGVKAAVGVAPTQVVTRGQDQMAAQVVAPGARPADIASVLDLGVREGDLADLRGRTVAMSSTMAGGHHVGDTLRFWLGDGTPVSLRLVAVYRRGLGFGDYLLPWEVAGAHTTARTVSTILVSGTVSADAVRQATGWPGLTVAGSAVLHSQDEKDQDLNAWMNYMLLGMLIAFTAIAVGNTLVMATLDRTGEFARLRLTGATRRQVTRMVRWEVLVVVLIAAAIGTAAAVGTLVPFSTGVTGSRTPYVPPLWYLTLLAGMVVLGLVATGLPARVALRPAPAEAAGGRE
ncbi:MAG: ABC transporter permease [Mycobacteriales bacterium]